MLNESKAREAVTALLDTHVAERLAFDRIHEYMCPWDSATAVAHIGASMESKNRAQHAEIARMSAAPFVSLVVDTYSQSLKVDGFYTREHDHAAAWQWWQRNKMKARQTGLHRAALTYGTSYASVLPADGGEAVHIDVYSPRRMVTYYGDTVGLPGRPASSDEFPMLALEIGRRHMRLFDEQYVYYFGIQHTPAKNRWYQASP